MSIPPHFNSVFPLNVTALFSALILPWKFITPNGKKVVFSRVKIQMKNSNPLMFRLTLLILFCLLVLISEKTYSQGSVKALVKGKVLDSLSAAPLGFASIRIFENVEKKLVNGNITTESGDFSIDLHYGRYYAEIEFMGYRSYKTSPFLLSEADPEHNFGEIKLTASVNTLDEVVVQAENISTCSMSLILAERGLLPKVLISIRKAITSCVGGKST